jgi:hypothetical protein
VRLRAGRRTKPHRSAAAGDGRTGGHRLGHHGAGGVCARGGFSSHVSMAEHRASFAWKGQRGHSVRCLNRVGDTNVWPQSTTLEVRSGDRHWPDRIDFAAQPQTTLGFRPRSVVQRYRHLIDLNLYGKAYSSSRADKDARLHTCHVKARLHHLARQIPHGLLSAAGKAVLVRQKARQPGPGK